MHHSPKSDGIEKYALLLSGIIIALIVGTAIFASRQTAVSVAEAETTTVPTVALGDPTETIAVTADFVEIAEATPETILTVTESSVSTPVITRVTPTNTATATNTPTATYTLTPSNTPTETPTSTNTPTSTATHTATATYTPTPTPTVGPTQDAAAGSRFFELPILMYHRVEPWPEDAGELREGLTVQPDMFRLQLEYLRDNGYEDISLYEMQYALTQGREIPEKSVIFTFDDGYRDNYEYAFPIMQEFGFTGTLFLVTEFMDEGREEYLTWDMALEMHEAGWDLEPHTKTHASLTEHNHDYVIYEVLGSMETIKHYVGYQPRFFVYPYGAYDDDVVQIIRDIGFWGALTTKRSLTQSIHYPLERGRIRVSGRDTMQDFKNRLAPLPTPTPEGDGVDE